MAADPLLLRWAAAPGPDLDIADITGDAVQDLAHTSGGTVGLTVYDPIRLQAAAHRFRESLSALSALIVLGMVGADAGRMVSRPVRRPPGWSDP